MIRRLISISFITLFMPLAWAGNELLKIGVSEWTEYPDNVAGFKHSMAEEGFIEGINVEYIYQKSGANNGIQKEIAESFDNVDLIYSLTTPGTAIIKETVNPQTPIVFSIVTYPADSGLIESFEYSGNNLVGTSNYIPLNHYLDLLQTVLPKAKKLAIFHRKGEPNSKIQASNIIRLMQSKGITVIDLEPETVDQMREMAQQVSKDVDAFMTTTDTLCQGGGEDAIIPISLATNTPILSSNKNGILKGSAFGAVSDFYTLGAMSGKAGVIQ